MGDITTSLWWLKGFLLVTVVVGVRGQGEVFFFNEEMDGLCSQLREDIKHSNNSQIPLPNIGVVYTRDLYFLSLRGEWNGTSGVVRDMSTIRRTSNATIVTSKGYFVFRAEFGFENLKVGYKYSAKFLGIPIKGDLNLEVEDNSIYVELLVNLTDNRCSGDVATIRNLRFITLDRISAKVTGFSIANGMMSYWLTHSLYDVSADIIAPIENALRTFFKENIKHFDFCKFGSVPENVPFDDMDSSVELSGEISDVNQTKFNEFNAILN